MLTGFPTISTATSVARSLGFTGDELARLPLRGRDIDVDALDLQGARLALPVLLNAYLPQSYDTTATKEAKTALMKVFESLAKTLRGVDQAVRAVGIDNRYSDSGRAERRAAFFKDWERSARWALSPLRENLRAIEKDLKIYTTPGPIQKDNLAGALLDQEYRAVVRGMFAGELAETSQRARHLQFLQFENPEHPAVNAVLRADGIASGIPAEHHKRLRVAHAVLNYAEALRSIWAAADMADAVFYMLDRGTERAAELTGAMRSPEHRALRAEFDFPARGRIGELIELVAHDALLIKAYEGDRVPEAERVS
jgi:hypothetical protein